MECFALFSTFQQGLNEKVEGWFEKKTKIQNYVLFFAVTVIKPRVLWMLSKHFATELHPSALYRLLLFEVNIIYPHFRGDFVRGNQKHLENHECYFSFENV